MTPAEVASLFRIYIDEPDATFVSDNEVETYLDAGYREFRNIVSDIDPSIYNVSQNIVVSSARSYDLKTPPTGQPSFLGPTPTATNGRLVRLNNFYKLHSDGSVHTVFEAVSSRESLRNVHDSYFLANNILNFSHKLTGTFSVQYVPEASITWVLTSPSTFIDDLTPFHDLIALLATKQYAIQDGAASDTVVAQMSDRLIRFEEYLRERAYPGVGYVQPVPWMGA